MNILERYLSESHFMKGDTVRCRKSGLKGKVIDMKGEGDKEIYIVKNEKGEMEYNPSDLELAEQEEDKEFDEEEDEEDEEIEEKKCKKKMNESISEEDIKKVKEAGHSAAKDIFKKEYDKEKAEKLINDVIEKNKEKAKDGEDLSQIVINSFRG